MRKRQYWTISTQLFKTKAKAMDKLREYLADDSLNPGTMVIKVEAAERVKLDIVTVKVKL